MNFKFDLPTLTCLVGCAFFTGFAVSNLLRSSKEMWQLAKRRRELGIYVNPPSGTKEEWLAIHGINTGTEPCEITETHLPVCLVHNGVFTAAAVGYEPREVATMRAPVDRRAKTWFRVSREDLRKVSGLAKVE